MKKTLPVPWREASILLSCWIDDFDDWATSEELPTGLFSCAFAKAGSYEPAFVHFPAAAQSLQSLGSPGTGRDMVSNCRLLRPLLRAYLAEDPRDRHHGL